MKIERVIVKNQLGQVADITRLHHVEVEYDNGAKVKVDWFHGERVHLKTEEELKAMLPRELHALRHGPSSISVYPGEPLDATRITIKGNQG